MNKRNDFICIGAVHPDYILKLKNNYFKKRTNPVIHDKKLGGVAFNIASKIAFINEKIELNSLNCNYTHKKEIKKQGIKFKAINKTIHKRFYSSVLNKKGQLILGLANMDVYEKNINLKLIKKLKNKNIILDLNFSEKLINFLINKYYKNNYICVCGTSAHKVYKIRSLLTKIDTLILNKQESLILTNKNSIKLSLKYLIKKNNNLNIIITNGKNSVYAYKYKKIYLCKPPRVVINNENSAGDALCAIFNYFFCNSNNMYDSLRKSVVAGALQAVGNINNKKKYLQKINSLSNKINIKVNNYNG